LSSHPGTFSIVAADLASGEVGCAVQSKYFSVGSVVPWVRAGVGAAATQAMVMGEHGRRALEELAGGASPEEALERSLAGDPGRDLRQVGVVTADGRAASFTGERCLDWAGHRLGAGFAVQGNILAGPEVVDEMARAFEETVGPLAERLVAALEAGQAAGGDKRGQQSAAVVVERVGAGSARREGVDRICDLRVEDHPAPIAELRRVLGIWTVWEAQRAANAAYERGDAGAAADLLGAVAGDDATALYNLACYESLAGRRDDALTHLRRSIELDRSFRALADDDADFDALRADVSALS
jgi:uncharacterized Ntn-hydrolase superfamily protein